MGSTADAGGRVHGHDTTTFRRKDAPDICKVPGNALNARGGLPATEAAVGASPSAFHDRLLFMLKQLRASGRSFWPEMQDNHLDGMAALFKETTVAEKAHWCRAGDEAGTMAIVLDGALAVGHQDPPSTFLLPGDMTGENELCGDHSRSADVRALAPTVLAEIGFEDMARFVEGLGLKKAKMITKIIADVVLQNVKVSQSCSELADRNRLEAISQQGRRNAFTVGRVVGSKNLSEGPQKGLVSPLESPVAQRPLRSRIQIAAVHAASPLKSDSGSPLGTRSVSKEQHVASETGSEYEHKVLIDRHTVPINKTYNSETLKSFDQTLSAACAGIRLFEKMSDKLLKKIRMCWHTVKVCEGDVIYAKGDPCEAFFVVHHGDVGIFADSATVRQTGQSDRAVGKGPRIQCSEESEAEQFSVSDDQDQDSPQRSDKMSPLAMNRSGSLPALESIGPSPEANLTIEYTPKGVPGVELAEASGWIQVRRRKRSMKSDPISSRMVLKGQLPHAAYFCENALVSGAPHNVTICALRDSTLLVLGRERFAHMRLQYEQERFKFLKDLIKRTPYAKHLAEEDVCKLVDAVVIKEYVDGSFILNECSNQDECFTVVRGCAVRVKASLTDTGDYEEKQRFEEGQTFAETALEDELVTGNISKVTICPTYKAAGATSLVVMSRSIYRSLIGRYVTEENRASALLHMCSDDDGIASTDLLQHAGGSVAKSKPKTNNLELPTLRRPALVAPDEARARVRSRLKVGQREDSVKVKSILDSTGILAKFPRMQRPVVPARESEDKPVPQRQKPGRLHGKLGLKNKHETLVSTNPKEFKTKTSDLKPRSKSKFAGPTSSVAQNTTGSCDEPVRPVRDSSVHVQQNSTVEIPESKSPPDSDDSDLVQEDVLIISDEYSDDDDHSVVSSRLSTVGSRSASVNEGWKQAGELLGEDGGGEQKYDIEGVEQQDPMVDTPNGERKLRSDASETGQFAAGEENQTESQHMETMDSRQRIGTTDEILVSEVHELLERLDGLHSADAATLMGSFAELLESFRDSEGMLKDYLLGIFFGSRKMIDDRGQQRMDERGTGGSEREEDMSSSMKSDCRLTSTAKSKGSKGKQDHMFAIRQGMRSRTATPLVRTEILSGSMLHPATVLFPEVENSDLLSSGGSPVKIARTPLEASDSSSGFHSQASDNNSHMKTCGDKAFQPVLESQVLYKTADPIHISHQDGFRESAHFGNPVRDELPPIGMTSRDNLISSEKEIDHRNVKCLGAGLSSKKGFPEGAIETVDPAQLDLTSVEGAEQDEIGARQRLPDVTSRRHGDLGQIWPDVATSHKKTMPAPNVRTRKKTRDVQGQALGIVQKAMKATESHPREGNLARTNAGRSCELIPNVDIPGPGAYFRQVFSEDPRGIRIDLNDPLVGSKLREIIKRAKQLPGPGEYDGDLESILARQRRISVKAKAVEHRKDQKLMASNQRPQQDADGSRYATLQKREGYNSIKDAIRRFASHLKAQPSKELPAADDLCVEVLECGAAKRVYDGSLLAPRR